MVETMKRREVETMGKGTKKEKRQQRQRGYRVDIYRSGKKEISTNRPTVEAALRVAQNRVDELRDACDWRHEIKAKIIHNVSGREIWLVL